MKDKVFYAIKKQRYWFQSWLNIGHKNSISFIDNLLTCEKFETLEEAQHMCDKLNNTPNWLDVYKGTFKVYKYTIRGEK